MTQKNNEIISYASPHTIKKFGLIERYVKGWAPKLLNYGKCEGIVYIDCMSNSGYYYQDKDTKKDIIEGSAIRVARTLNEVICPPNKKIEVFFNDISKERKNYLEAKLQELNLKRINFKCSCEDANIWLRKFSEFSIKKYANYNILLVYDPYQASIDWDALTPFFNVWGEIIINHMGSDSVRGLTQVKKPDKIKKYETTYQRNINALISEHLSKDELEKLIIDIIKKKSVDCSGKTPYIASFPFFNRTNGLLYNLVHVTKHIEGFELFKESAWGEFGGKSSIKHVRNPGQTVLDFFTGGVKNNPDSDCYEIRDIAQYIYSKYCEYGEYSIKQALDELKLHPVFPSYGYRTQIRVALQDMGVKIKNGRMCFEK